jgi:putative phosphoesterase
MVIFVVNVPVLDRIPPIEKRSGMKLVGLISDTHVPSRSKKLPDRVFEIFKNADLIIHAGDLTQIEIVKELEKIAPVVAVHGNMDPQKARSQLPAFNSTELLGHRIGVTHDPGALWGMNEMKRLAKEKGLNVLVFGHTHKQSVKWEDDTLFINPGSATDPLPPLLVKPTVGLLLVTEQKVEPFIIRV